jgi:hypothetical protein
MRPGAGASVPRRLARPDGRACLPNRTLIRPFYEILLGPKTRV